MVLLTYAAAALPDRPARADKPATGCATTAEVTGAATRILIARVVDDSAFVPERMKKMGFSMRNF